jgi:hypothetical protein
MKPLVKSETKLSLLVVLLLYSFFYGFVLVNWIDLFVSPRHVPGYHLWLAIVYFTPFITVLFLRGLEDWELAVSLGLFTSLMNDLFYYIAGRLLFGIHVDLVYFYKCQLLPVCEKPLEFDFFFTKLKPYPLLMPLSIYARATLVYLLLYKWWTDGSPP